MNKINKYISVLRELRIIKREIPVTEKNDEKSRRGIYSIDDPFFRFWFRYIYTNKSYLEEGDYKVPLNIIKESLNTFTGFIFEQICIENIGVLNKENKLPFNADKIGRWWDGKSEIDIVAFNSEGYFLFCECKWTDRKVGINLFNELKTKSEKFPNAKERYYTFFSKSGFTEDLIKLSKKQKNILLF